MLKPFELPAIWLPNAKMLRIICHWTAGAYNVSEIDKDHYHFIINGAADVVKGRASIKLNEAPIKAGYAAHTLNCNSGSIGVSLACMAGAIENPFTPGTYPMLEIQWKRLIDVVSQLAKKYKIPVTSTTILSHAEVQNNLGIRQRGKWDYTRLAFDLSIKGSKACGDKLRKEVALKLAKGT